MGSTVFPAAGGGVTQKVQEFTSTGTFTVPSNCSAVEVFVVGGGGAGGGGRGHSASTSPGMGLGGGGGGGIVRSAIVPVTPGASYTVTVGAGGTGASGQGNSTAGSNSSFGSLVVANGGGAGASMDYVRGSYSTRYNANIVGGTLGGDSYASTTSTEYAGNGGGAGGTPVSLFTQYNGGLSAYSGYSNYSQPVPTQGFAGFGTTYGDNKNYTAGAGIGIYGWGAVGASPYNGNIGGGTAGSPSYGVLERPSGSPYTRPGGNGTANTGSAGAGSGAISDSSAAAANANGGNGGSGFVRVVYWS